MGARARIFRASIQCPHPISLLVLHRYTYRYRLSFTRHCDAHQIQPTVPLHHPNAARAPSSPSPNRGRGSPDWEWRGRLRFTPPRIHPSIPPAKRRLPPLQRHRFPPHLAPQHAISGRPNRQPSSVHGSQLSEARRGPSF